MKKHKYKSFGVMIDMSRNSVMKKETLFEFLRILKKMGYNCVMLYTEDTYEVPGQEYFGYLRGRYSQQELKEIDDYAYSLGMEVIPCIQTLAHLNAFINWGKCPVDCADILLTDDERTYKLIDDMFKSISECFRSRRVHIGMDEAHMLGRGKHLDIHGYETVDVIMKRHLERVNSIAKAHGYSVMMWSDMFFRGWNKGAYHAPRQIIPKEYIDALPEGVAPVYWDYYTKDKNHYDDMFYNHKQFSDDVWFAGGAWTWSGIAPHNSHSLNTMLPAMQSCRDNKVYNVFITLWGDDGGECSQFTALPALLHIIEAANGNTDIEKIKAKFKRIVGAEYDDFMALDLPNKIGGVENSENPSKYMLYSDPFLGFLDYTVKESDAESYKEYADKLLAISKKYRKYSYLFKTEAKLCELLALKYAIGKKTRRIYENGSKDDVKALAEEYKAITALYRELHKIYSFQWHKDFKPHGFDIQDLRLGGIEKRFESCRERLLLYANGKLDKIEELEESILPYGKAPEGTPIRLNTYKNYASPNTVTHI